MNLQKLEANSGSLPPSDYGTSGTFIVADTALEPDPEKQKDDEGPDGGWGWVLVGAAFVSTSLVYGTMRSLGVFFVEFVEYFDASAQSISWITSTTLGCQQFFSPLAAALCKAYDPRVVVMTGGFLGGLGFILASQATSLLHLFLSLSLLTGFGWGLVFSPLLGFVLASFTKRRNIALGVVFCSIGLSAFAFNPLFRLLINSYSWRGALLIVGAMNFNILACGALIRPPTPSKAKPKNEGRSSEKWSIMGALRRTSSYLELSLLLERAFLTFTIVTLLEKLGHFVPYFHLVAQSQQAGFSDYQSAFVVSVSGIAEIVGRLLSGYISDLGYFRLVHLLSFWAIFAGLSIMLLPVSSITGSYVSQMVMASLYGLSTAAASNVVFGVLPFFTGAERLMGGLGLHQLVVSFGGLLGTPLSGLLRDITGNYLVSFGVAGFFFIISFGILATLPHFFSCTDPTSWRRFSDEKEESDVKHTPDVHNKVDE